MTETKPEGATAVNEAKAPEQALYACNIETARRIIEWLRVVPDVSIPECCEDHAVDNILEALEKDRMVGTFLNCSKCGEQLIA